MYYFDGYNQIFFFINYMGTPVNISSVFVNTFLMLLMYLGFPGGSVIKNLLANQEMLGTWVWSLVWEVLLEEEMATHISILLSMDRRAGVLQSMGSQTVGHNWAHTHEKWKNYIHYNFVFAFSSLRTIFKDIHNDY